MTSRAMTLRRGLAAASVLVAMVGVGAMREASAAPDVEPSAALEADAHEDYDPWAPFNERTFRFNHRLDRFVLKPVARAWDKVLPDPIQRGLANAFHNAAMPKRLVNSLLQGKGDGAMRELGRFLLNSTLGVGGLIDVAKVAGVPASDEDTGQTLGAWGVDPGPYLVLPFLPPLTVRDGVGFAIDSLLNPVGYLAPFIANAGMKATDTVNSRAENLEVFEDVEESAIDLYSAVRNGYLQRRQKAIEE